MNAQISTEGSEDHEQNEKPGLCYCIICVISLSRSWRAISDSLLLWRNTVQADEIIKESSSAPVASSN